MALLLLIQTGIAQRDEAVCGGRFQRVGCQSGAHVGHGKTAATHHVDRLPNPLDDGSEMWNARLLQERRVLVASKAIQAIMAPQLAREDPRDHLEQLVAPIVPFVIVHLLESIQIQDHHGDGLTTSFDAKQGHLKIPVQ